MKSNYIETIVLLLLILFISAASALCYNIFFTIGVLLLFSYIAFFKRKIKDNGIIIGVICFFLIVEFILFMLESRSESPEFFPICIRLSSVIYVWRYAGGIHSLNWNGSFIFWPFYHWGCLYYSCCCLLYLSEWLVFSVLFWQNRIWKEIRLLGMPSFIGIFRPIVLLL